eukprot:m.95711 g.95711  ORF g.95711 m.95711 type:complete len:496 (+) comp13509_c0_seq2:63-1550(+)
MRRASKTQRSSVDPPFVPLLDMSGSVNRKSLVDGMDSAPYETKRLIDDEGDSAYEEDEEMIAEAPPERLLTYIGFYIQGIGCLFPWNAFITVTHYFGMRLKNSHFESNFENYFTFGFQLLSIIFLYILSKKGQDIPIYYRLIPPLAAQILIFGVITAMISIEMDGDTFFGITMALAMLSAISTAFFQGGLFGLAAMMKNQHYSQALMAGQGLAGVSVSALNLLTIVVFKDDSNKAAALFFGIALVVSVASFVSAIVLLREPIVRHSIVDVAKHVRRLSVMDDQFMNRTRPFHKIRGLAIQVALVFVLSLSLFPAIAVTVQSQFDNYYGNNLFIPIYCFIGFNVGDYVGRSLPKWIKIPSFRQRGWLWAGVLCRFGFIPLFMLCNLHIGTGENEVKLLKPLFFADWIPYVLMLLLGISNGYFSTLCMMYAPGSVDKEDQEWAGSTMLLFLVFGLTMGSLSSFALRAALCECNPFISEHVNKTVTEAVTKGFIEYLQ